MLHLIHYPNVQERCYQEIRGTCDKQRISYVKDTSKFNFLEATIMEVMRKCDIAPFAFSHCASHDVELSGYSIPHDAWIIPNLNSALHDKQIWKDPECFRPQRFLNSDGTLKKYDEFIPFGIGES